MLYPAVHRPIFIQHQAIYAKLGFIGYESVEDVESNYGINVGGSDLSFGMYWAF